MQAKKIIPVLFLTGILCSCAHDSFTASGIVVNKKNVPLAGVLIINGAYSDSIRTDSAGKFEFSVFEAGFRTNGKQPVEFSKTGYRTKNATLKKRTDNVIRLKKRN